VGACSGVAGPAGLVQVDVLATVVPVDASVGGALTVTCLSPPLPVHLQPLLSTGVIESVFTCKKKMFLISLIYYQFKTNLQTQDLIYSNYYFFHE
jgi:hypothetical protein